MSKIAIFGATGAIGQSIAAALRIAGQPYRVVGRSRTALETQYGADPLRKEQEDVLLEADANRSIRGAILRLPDFYDPNRIHHFLTEAPWSANQINHRRLEIMNKCSQTKIRQGFTLEDYSGNGRTNR